MSRARVALGALVVVAVRRTPWRAAVVASAAGAAVLWTAAWRHDIALDPPTGLAAALLATIAATSLEDGAEALTVTTPFGGLRRRGVAVVVSGLLIAGAWVVIVVVARAIVGSAQPGVPLARPSWQFVAFASTGWAVACTLAALTGWNGSAVRSAAGLLALVLGSAVAPSSRRWLSSAADWQLALTAASALAWFVQTSRDRRRRRPARRPSAAITADAGPTAR